MSMQHRSLQISEDAADWLLKLQARDDGDSEEVRRGFIAWLKHSPQHVEEFLLMTATMRVVRRGGEKAEIDIDQLLAEATTNVVPLSKPHLTPALSALRGQRARWRGRWRIGVVGIAAAALMMVGVATWMMRTSADIYATPIGEQRSVKLDDGSLVYLNTRSRIEVEFSHQRRDVRLLEGEALFVVARDTTRSFRVLTDSAVVQALGTQFNVYAHEAATTVSVLEGRVQVAPEKILSSGEQADIHGDGRVVQQRTPNLTKAVAWRQRRLVFQNDPLADIAREFNRYNRMQIRVEGEAAAQRRFTAVFNADEPQALLNFLHGDPGLTMDTKDQDVFIR